VTTTKRDAQRERAKDASDDSTFVQSDEFLSLLLSRRDVVRVDTPDGEIRGLLDRSTGKRYMIEQAKLLAR